MKKHRHFLIPTLVLLAGLAGCQTPQNEPAPRAETDQREQGPFPDEQRSQMPGDESVPTPGQTAPPGEPPTQSPMGPGP